MVAVVCGGSGTDLILSTQSGMAGSAARTAALVSQVYTTSRYLGVSGHGSPNTREVTARLQEAAWAPEHRAATWRSVVGWMQRVDQEPDEAAGQTEAEMRP